VKRRISHPHRPVAMTEHSPFDDSLADDFTAQFGDRSVVRVDGLDQREDHSLGHFIIRLRIRLHRKVLPFGATAPGRSTAAGAISSVGQTKPARDRRCVGVISN